MSTNQIQEGKYLDLVAPSGGVVSGNGYLIGGLLVIAQADADATEEFVGCSEGVFELPKETPQALTAGAIAFWNGTAGEVDVTGSGFYPCGTVVEAAGSADATCKVKLFGYATAAV